MKNIKYLAALLLMSAIPMSAFGMFRPFITTGASAARTASALRALSTRLDSEFNEEEYKEAKKILTQKAYQHNQKVAKKGDAESTVFCKSLLKNSPIRSFIAHERLTIRAKQLIEEAKELDRKKELLDKYFPQNSK
jgi:hypothetical protein